MFTAEQLLTVAGLVIFIEVVLMVFRLKSLVDKFIKDLVWRDFLMNIVVFIVALIGYWIGLAVPFIALSGYWQPMLLTAIAATAAAIGTYEVVNNIAIGKRGPPTA